MTAEKHTQYFSTRDLLMMAALAALGGVAGTYINALGDVFQSILGFAGTTQWAAGLHVVWIVLAVGLTDKAGAGTATGILKGAVELLSGNSHGLLVMLIDLVAGLLVDLGFLPFRDKRNRIAYMVAGGLAAASNVFVFQLFAALPVDILAVGAMFAIGLVAFISGVIFAGLLGDALVRALERAGIVRPQAVPAMSKRATAILYGVLTVLTVAFAVILVISLKGPATIEISGSGSEPYAYAYDGTTTLESHSAMMNGVNKSYKGIPLRDVIDAAAPASDEGMVLITASDGYAFFISMTEINSNDALMLVPKGDGDDASYDVMGALNSKAWVRSVASMALITAEPLPIDGELEQSGVYDPDTWQFDMDAFTIDVGNGPQKVQGAPLGLVLESMSPTDAASKVVMHGRNGDSMDLAFGEVMNDEAICIFTVIGEDAVTYAVANTNGTVLMADTAHIEVSQ